MVLEKLHEFVNTTRIERAAKKIDDPIERLKYLRHATSEPAISAAAKRRWSRGAAFGLVAVLLCLRSDAHLRRSILPGTGSGAVRIVKQNLPNVWLIEEAKDYEVYSNGLRIEKQLAVANKPRSYPLLTVGTEIAYGPRRSQPAGIVYHTTESDQAPFEATQQHALQRIGRELLLFVRNHRAYHYVVDRFGRVHRIVAESDSANHAGNSVWADEDWVYVDLNASFLGIAFEARMQEDQPSINEAQTHAAKVLTEMLRSKYNIPAENCVTHAQVSVNPDNMRIGWHSDWGKNFPFQQLELNDNYEEPLPSLYLFGFDYDPVYIGATGPGIWKGLELAEERLHRDAMTRHLAVAEYRRILQKRYRDQIAALRTRRADEEN